MHVDNTTDIERRVVGMYAEHPFPSIEDKAAKADAEMDVRLFMLGIRPEDYVGKKVLDAGCGTGEYSCWYAKRGALVTAVDLSEPSMKRASEYASANNIGNIQFLKRSVLNLDFPDHSFDFVYSMGVLHHTPDPYRGFLELCRVLKPGGTILVSLYNRYGRLRHNLKQRVVNTFAGEDVDRRVKFAKRLFPGTCRTLKKNQHDVADTIIYDAFGIPHESQHTIGELLKWFDKNGIKYLGAFGPVTVRDTLLALRLMQQDPSFGRFNRFFEGFPMAQWAVKNLPKLLGRGAGNISKEQLRFTRPSWASRGIVQLCWFALGFRFSIFSLSGKKAGSSNPA